MTLNRYIEFSVLAELVNSSLLCSVFRSLEDIIKQSCYEVQG